jgi:hypothetical protein
MKLRALLLSLFVLFLSVKPMMEQVFSQTALDACCETKANELKEHAASTPSDEKGCDDLCSPFQPCCPYITFSAINFTLNTPRVFSLVEKALPIYQVSFSPGYSSDFWQPPRNV